MAYTYQYLDESYPVSITQSACTVGATARTSSLGSGSVTLEVPPFPYPSAADIELWHHYDLTIDVGGVQIHPAFDTYMQEDYQNEGVLLPNTTLDIGDAGPIIDFASGSGSGALQELCAYQPASGAESCTADGTFVWTQ